jgi:hypothetical protein
MLGPMRAPALLPLLALLSGCHAATVAAPPLLGLEVASVMLFQRTLVDIAYSAASGQDCSLVRLDRGLAYCRPPDPQETPALTCTRSLGVPDCWTNPEALTGNTRRIEDAKPRSELHNRQ